MIYLSQVINKKIHYKHGVFGKVVDLIVSDNKLSPVIDLVLVKQAKEKYLVSADTLSFENNQWHLKSETVSKVPFEDNRFYLAEDLLDKQVIDVNGKRLVRVNDIVLRENGQLKVEGIDIGLSGVLRRLGVPMSNMRTITLPWSLIEAFDYSTGNIQLKLTQSKLNTFHPAEIADILEDAGTKERLGLVKALDTQKAANAISEADEETQAAILEEVPTYRLRSIVEQMKASSIADIIDKLNPFTTNEIFSSLGSEKAKKIKRLLVFEDDEAGRLMDFSFIKEKGTKTVGEMTDILANSQAWPETLVIVDNDDKILGILGTRMLLNRNRNILLNDIIRKRNFVYTNSSFSQILKMFAEYNLRLLPVVDHEKKVVGAISIDRILQKIQEEEEIEDAI